MIKHICAIFLFLISCVSARTTDTLFVDTSFVSGDSLRIVTTDTTSVIDSLSTLQKIQPDTLVPITVRILSGESTIIGRKTFLFTPYRYTGDLLRPLSLSFTKDLGFIGQPHEIFIYGVGGRGVSFLQDGVLWNNRYSNSLDLNLVQSEDIDSIEIVPSPRGFLYGPYNNPVAVNFIMRDFLSPEPYTRIRYYEGPNGEAMIDGKFNAQIAKRWNLSFQASNRSVDETYKNTDLSIWQANAKLKYFLSNSVNITGFYSFVSSSIGLNGGIDIDSVRKITSDVNSVIYDPAAPVVYPNRILDILQHNFGLRTLVKPFDNSQLDLSLYYHYILDELRDLQDTLEIADDIETKSYGAFIKYSQRIDLLSFKISSIYEKNKSYQNNKNVNSSYYEDSFNYLAFSSVLTLNLFDDKLKPSVFYKYYDLHLEGFNSGRSGAGVDIEYEPTKNLSFYAGISKHSGHSIHDRKALEIGGKFSNSNVLIDVRFIDNEYDLYDRKIVAGPTPAVVLPSTKVSGFGLNLNYQYWKILIETNTSYYFNDNKVIGVPELQFTGGLYLKSKFFDDNLNLKSGFTFYYTGKRSSFSGEWGFVDVEPTNKIDFILIGEIQELAIVYFVWENLFDNQYFITPYYPMPESSIRFGLSWELFN